MPKTVTITLALDGVQPNSLTVIWDPPVQSLSEALFEAIPQLVQTHVQLRDHGDPREVAER